MLVDGTHLIVPVSNKAKGPSNILLGIYDDSDQLVQNFMVGLPQDKAVVWLAAYPIDPFGLRGKQITIAPVDGGEIPESCRAAFESIKIGSADDDVLPSNDYNATALPYRNQFHASPRRGWNNDPNGMVYSNGKYHLYYQYNPFAITWGNMHWGHLESTDLVHWEERPIALYQHTTQDQAFSGGGFVDHADSAGLGQLDTLFVAFTSTGRGECLAYSLDGGLSFTELPENPVVQHMGRDPKIIWYPPEQKWVMIVFDYQACAETEATPPQPGTLEGHLHDNIAFYESKNLREWTRTGAFTDPDRMAVYECPEMFELMTQVAGESRWILQGAQNRYFIGHFDGQTFRKESGPLGTTHGAFYAAQTFSNVPDGRRIQIGWARPDIYVQQQFPNQIVSQAFSLPHELTLRETNDGLRIYYSPIQELESLRSEILVQGTNLTPVQANDLLQICSGKLTEVWIEVDESRHCQIIINGMDASFDGRTARIFTDCTFNEVYINEGISYELHKPQPKDFPSIETKFTAAESTVVSSLKIYRLLSIWDQRESRRL